MVCIIDQHTRLTLGERSSAGSYCIFKTRLVERDNVKVALAQNYLPLLDRCILCKVEREKEALFIVHCGILGVEILSLVIGGERTPAEPDYMPCKVNKWEHRAVYKKIERVSRFL